MRAFPLVLLLAACTLHQAELTAIQVSLDKQLAEKVEIAQNLNQYRRELDELELKVRSAGGGPLPEVTPPLKLEPALALPPESFFEGEDGKRRRIQIAQTRRRILEIEKLIGEVNNVEVRKKQATEKLRALNEARKNDQEASWRAYHAAEPKMAPSPR